MTRAGPSDQNAPASDFIRAQIHLSGNVSSPAFPDWIRRHAHKLGLKGITLHADVSGVTVHTEGPEPMVQALALGASLGPEDVLVDAVSVTSQSSSAGGSAHEFTGQPNN